jgi:hypothetical protein
MSTEAINRTQTSQNGITRTRHLLSLVAVLAFTSSLSATTAHAQVIGGLEVSIPFQFYAGDAKLPPGKYTVHTVDSTDLTVMEISSADGSASALFAVRDAEANSTPAKSELIFNKYGNRYFLAKLFDEGNPNGNSVDESRYEKKVGQAIAEAQAHVPALHRGQ